MSGARAVTVEVFADPICPWCYLGWRGLERAVALRPDVTVTRLWRPYLLNPRMPKGGVDRHAWYESRVSADPERWSAARQALRDMAAALGAPLDLDAAKVLPSTIDAHRVIHWGYGQKVGIALVDALFTAFWVEGADIGRAAVLAEVAGRTGLNAGLVLDLLERDDDVDLVLSQHEAAHRGGVAGVPVMLYGRKVATQGADAPDVYARAIDLALKD